MNYHAIGSIINLLSVSRPLIEEIILIKQLNNFFNFDHNVFLMEYSLDINRFVNTEADDLTPRSLYVFKSDEKNITGLESLKNLQTKNTFLIVVTASGDIEKNLQLQIQVKEIQRSHKNMKIGVFFSQVTSSDDLKKYFKWFWNNRIVNIFVVSKRSNHENLLDIFTYNPFGTFNVINVTGSEFDDYFLDKNSNFEQHQLRVGINRVHFQLSDKHLWLSVFSVLNASFTEIETNFRITNALELEHGEIDIMAGIVTCEEGQLINMYPISMGTVVIMVPAALPYPEISAYLRTLTTGKFFIFSSITFAVVISLLTISRYMKQKKILFFHSSVDVVNLLLNDNGAIEYRKLSRIEVCLIVPLTFAGFIIINGFLSILQSYLTEPILQPQIDTLEDIYKSPFPIFTVSDTWTQRVSVVLESQSAHGDWVAKFRVIDDNSENTLYSSLVSLVTEIHTANVYLDVQKRLNIRGFHIPSFYIQKFIGSYLVNEDFPFTDRLNEIIHWIRNAGLYDKWRELDFKDIESTVLSFSQERMKYFEGNEINRFSVPIFIVYGWLAALLVLCIEIFWKRYNLSCILSRIEHSIYLRFINHNNRMFNWNHIRDQMNELHLQTEDY